MYASSLLKTAYFILYFLVENTHKNLLVTELTTLD